MLRVPVTGSDERRCAEPSLLELCSHLRTTYPVLSLLPLSCVSAIEQLLKSRKWTTQTNVRCMNRDALVLMRLIKVAMSRNNGTLPSQLDKFLNLLLKHVQSLEDLSTLEDAVNADYTEGHLLLPFYDLYRYIYIYITTFYISCIMSA